MKMLCTDIDLIRLELYRIYLNNAGIATEIRNEMLSGLMGVLPMSETCPELWVVNDDDYDRANAIIIRIESSQEESLQ